MCREECRRQDFRYDSSAYVNAEVSLFRKGAEVGSCQVVVGEIPQTPTNPNRWLATKHGQGSDKTRNLQRLVWPQCSRDLTSLSYWIILFAKEKATLFVKLFF